MRREKNNQVVVTNIAHFPAPVAGVITLTNNLQYLISGTVNIGINRLVMGINTTIIGTDPLLDKLVYTGTSAMISGTNVSGGIRRLTITASGVGSTVYNLTGAGTYLFQSQECIYAGCTSLGTINNFILCIFDKNFITQSSNGLTFSGTNGDLFIIDNDFDNNLNTAGCKFINFATGTTVSDIAIVRNFFHCQANESAIVQAGTLTISQYAKIVLGSFSGAGTYLTGISPTSVEWTIDNNTGIRNSNANGVIGYTGNATTTSVNNTYIMPAGTYTLAAGAAKFDMPSNGVLRYIGKTPATIRIIADVSAYAASAYGMDISISKNGGAPPAGILSGFTLYTGSATAGREFCSVIFTDQNAVMNDTYQVVVRKTTAGAVVTTFQDVQVSGLSI